MSSSRRSSVSLHESVRPLENGKGRIDPDKGVIYNVRVLGTTSTNGRKYLPEAIRKAAHLYEGISVRIDHPDKPDDQRSSESVLGWLRDVKVGQDGCLYANLHYLTSHPFAPRLVESVNRNPRCFALSHNSLGDTSEERGLVIVHEITEVRSVDLVPDAATNVSLFEGKLPRKFDARSRHPIQSRTHTRKRTPPTRDHRMATVTLREWFERTPLLPRDRRTIKRMFEADGSMSGMEDLPMDEPVTANSAVDDPADMSAEDHLKGGFSGACHAIIDDTTMDANTKIARLKDILKTHDRMVGDAGPENVEEEEEPKKPEEEEGDYGGEDEKTGEGDMLEGEGEEDDMLECDDDKLKGMYESKNPKLVARAKNIELRRFRREKSVRELCESEGYSPDAIDFEALCALPSDEKRMTLIESRKASQARTPRTRTQTTAQTITESRKTPGTGTTTTGDMSQLKDGDMEGFLAALQGRPLGQ